MIECLSINSSVLTIRLLSLIVPCKLKELNSRKIDFKGGTVNKFEVERISSEELEILAHKQKKKNQSTDYLVKKKGTYVARNFIIWRTGIWDSETNFSENFETNWNSNWKWNLIKLRNWCKEKLKHALRNEHYCFKFELIKAIIYPKKSKPKRYCHYKRTKISFNNWERTRNTY